MRSRNSASVRFVFAARRCGSRVTAISTAGHKTSSSVGPTQPAREVIVAARGGPPHLPNRLDLRFKKALALPGCRLRSLRKLAGRRPFGVDGLHARAVLIRQIRLADL